MSVITEVIVLLFSDDDLVQEVIGDIQKWVADHHHHKFGHVPSKWDSEWGGEKVASSDLLLGAFNHFDTQGFLAFIKSHPRYASRDQSGIVHRNNNTVDIQVMIKELDRGANDTWRLKS